MKQFAKKKNLTSQSQYIVKGHAFQVCFMGFFFFDSQNDSSHWLDMLKIFFTVLLKKEKCTYKLDGLWVSELTANVHFGVNYPFKSSSKRHLDFYLNEEDKIDLNN